MLFSFLASPPTVVHTAGMPDEPDRHRHLKQRMGFTACSSRAHRLRSRRERAVERAVLLLLVANIAIVGALVWLAMRGTLGH